MTYTDAVLADALEKRGLKFVKFSTQRDWVLFRVKHALVGCQKVGHWIYQNEKLVDMGKICIVCEQEFPGDTATTTP